MRRLSFGTCGAVFMVVFAAGCPAKPAATPGGAGGRGPVKLLNVSYDPTRELWQELNQAFIPQYEAETGQKLTIDQSHGGSASQARAIIDGLEADVATLSIWTDTDALRKQGLLKENWDDTLEKKSLPYTSTVVFVVRKGNPKNIKDWSDLVKPGVAVITPNPKTSGNGRLSLLGGWGSVVLNGGTEEQAVDYLTKLYRNVPNLDTGARAATMTFAQKGVGDVHLTMESEAYIEVKQSEGELELIYPAQSILHEPPVAIVDKIVDRKGTREAATAYLKFLYTKPGQEIIAKHYYRPTDPDVAEKVARQFPAIKRFPITDLAPTWDAAQTKFFADGAIFDRIYLKKE
jgi:sulfate/thiosulfate-binding protein